MDASVGMPGLCRSLPAATAVLMIFEVSEVFKLLELKTT